MVSNWREDLREIVDEIETKAEKKVKDTKGINNKVVINPKLDEAVKEIGGELLEVKEVDVDQKIKDREKEKEDEKKNKEANAINSLTPTGAQEDPSLKQKEKQANNMKKRVLLQKLRAVRSGAGDSIMASHEPEGEVIAEKDLNAAERRALPNKDFVFPGKGEGPEGKQRGAYPINDKKHARAALAMAAAHASPEKEAKVKAAVKKKYPDIEVSEATLMDKIKKWKGKKKPEKKATMDKTTDKLHDWRQKNSPEQKEREKYVSPFRPIVKEGKGYQPEIEHSKLGDAKKKKDKERESKLPPHLQGDAIGKMKKAFATEGKKRGLWDNIHAKRKRGEKPAKPGDKDYPKTLNVEGLEKARKNVGADKCWDGYKAKGTKKKGGKEVPNCVKEGAAWTKKSGKNPEGGLNEKGRKSYERENPGSDLKAPQPEGGSRKKSFCARMGGMKKKLTSAKTANDPDSRINKSLRKWKCNEAVKGQDREMRKMAAQDRAAGKDKRLSPKEGRRSVKPVRYRYNEADDKAYNYVVSQLKKKYGKDAVLTKGQKPKPPTDAQKKKNAEIMAKRAKEDGRDATEKASDGRYSDRYSNRGSD